MESWAVPPLLGGHMPMDPRFAQPLPYMAYQQKLRTLISQSPEWQDANERERYAQQFCDGDPRLAVFAHALRRKAVSALAKAHMMQYCRFYGYKSDIWAPRGPRRKRAPLPPPPTPPGSEGAVGPTQSAPTTSCSSGRAPVSASAPQPASSDSVVDSDADLSLQDQLNRLLPFTEACGQAASGSQALTAIHSGGNGAKHATMAVAEAAARYQKTCEFAGKVWRSLIDVSRVEWIACNDEPAYLCCLGKAYPAKKMLDALNEDLLNLTSAVSAYGAVQGQADPVSRVWVQELATYCTLSLQITARCNSVVAESQLGSLHSCLMTYVTSLEVLAAWAERSAEGWASRSQWTALLSAPKPGSDGSVPVVDPMAAAAPAIPQYLATPPLAFNWAKFERQAALTRGSIEDFLNGGSEPLMPGWVDLPDGIGLIDTLADRIESGVHYTGPPIDINMM